MKLPAMLKVLLVFAVLCLLWSTAMAFQIVPAASAASSAGDSAAEIMQAHANADAVQQLSSTQDFILKALAIVMPLLTLLATGFVAWMQFRVKQGQAQAAAAREANAAENRALTTQLGQSVDQAKQEIVAATRESKFFTGMAEQAQLDAARQPPDGAPRTTPTDQA